MIRNFRKYHRTLALIICLPSFLTIVTGVLFTIMDEWLEQEKSADFILKIHTMEIIHLGGLYPLLNGLGVLGLLVTGLSMSGLFRQGSKSPKSSDS